MKKLLLTTLCVLLAVASGVSQNTFNKKDLVLNLGVGLGNALHSGSYLKTTVPPISASLEYGVVDNLFDSKSSIGVGGYVGYAAQKFDYAGADAKYSDIVLGARGALHYQLVNKLDTYAGVSLGYDIISTSGDLYDGYSWSSSSVYFGGFLGARYYFTDKIGVMGELGYNIAILTVGASIKF